jgi:threonine/homoserine/homoserine lactone efflux protein
MQDAVSLYGFLTVGGMLAITPGPNMIYVISRSITQGRRAGLISLAGVIIGYLFYMFGAAFGITAFFLAVPYAAQVLSAGGAAYLAYLGWHAIRPGGHSPLQIREQLPRERESKLFVMGASTSLLNPKLAMVFLTLLPQFIDHQRGHVLQQSLFLGSLLIVLFALVNGSMALFSGNMAQFLSRRPGWLLVQRLLMGGTLLALSAEMALQAWR